MNQSIIKEIEYELELLDIAMKELNVLFPNQIITPQEKEINYRQLTGTVIGGIVCGSFGAIFGPIPAVIGIIGGSVTSYKLLY